MEKTFKKSSRVEVAALIGAVVLVIFAIGLFAIPAKTHAAGKYEGISLKEMGELLEMLDPFDPSFTFEWKEDGTIKESFIDEDGTMLTWFQDSEKNVTAFTVTYPDGTDMTITDTVMPDGTTRRIIS